MTIETMQEQKNKKKIGLVQFPHALQKMCCHVDVYQDTRTQD